MLFLTSFVEINIKLTCKFVVKTLAVSEKTNSYQLRKIEQENVPSTWTVHVAEGAIAIDYPHTSVVDRHLKSNAFLSQFMHYM